MTESQWEKRDAVVQTSVTMMHLEKLFYRKPNGLQKDEKILIFI